MTTTAPLTPARSAAWVEELRGVPLRYWLVAVGAGLLVWAGHLATPGLGGHASYADSVGAFFGGMWKLAGLMLLAAPVVGLRKPLVATGCASRRSCSTSSATGPGRSPASRRWSRWRS